MKEDLKKRKENEAENKYTNDCLTKVVENAEVDVPQVMIDEECDRMVNDFKQRLAQQGFTMEQFTQMTGQQESDIRAGMAVDAENKVKVRLVLEAVAKVENVEISEESIDEEYKRIADAYGMESDKVKELISSDSIAYDLKLRKAIEIVKKSKPAKKTEKE